ncbi:hypothetical protein PR048_029435 [Dryococelus australis]|uniref:Uncharacterized protein n=1 Tax=Dryococelus australis TaxID=614101 RepID=A0ABQ9GDD5_9NEOP|nr:hypothetical protein PR048_029435 [Dryococelus australis]
MPSSVRGKCDAQFLQDVLPEYLEEVPLHAREAMWFHFAIAARRQIDMHCPNRWISRGYPIAWPPRSPDFWLWGHDKIDVKHVCTEVDFSIGSQFIRHALDDSDPIADLQGNKTTFRRPVSEKHVYCLLAHVTDRLHPEIGGRQSTEDCKCAHRILKSSLKSGLDPRGNPASKRNRSFRRTCRKFRRRCAQCCRFSRSHCSSHSSRRSRSWIGQSSVASAAVTAASSGRVRPVAVAVLTTAVPNTGDAGPVTARAFGAVATVAVATNSVAAAVPVRRGAVAPTASAVSTHTVYPRAAAVSSGVAAVSSSVAAVRAVSSGVAAVSSGVAAVPARVAAVPARVAAVARGVASVANRGARVAAVATSAASVVVVAVGDRPVASVGATGANINRMSAVTDVKVYAPSQADCDGITLMLKTVPGSIPGPRGRDIFRRESFPVGNVADTAVVLGVFSGFFSILPRLHPAASPPSSRRARSVPLAGQPARIITSLLSSIRDAASGGNHVGSGAKCVSGLSALLVQGRESIQGDMHRGRKGLSRHDLICGHDCHPTFALAEPECMETTLAEERCNGACPAAIFVNQHTGFNGRRLEYPQLTRASSVSSCPFAGAARRLRGAVSIDKTEVDLAIGSQFIRHALNDSDPTAYLQGNK